MPVGTLCTFSPPAQSKDLDPYGLAQWNEEVNGWFENEIEGTAGSSGPPHKLTQFFNPTKTEYVVDQKPTPITWVGFPLKIRVEQASDDARWAAAEDPQTDLSSLKNGMPLQHDRENMDEYLEWSTLKDETTGDVLIASFTCEGPEYWDLIANSVSTAKILEMYKEMNPDFADQITLQDITYSSGKYKKRNKWNQLINTGTIAHLIQDNNTLSAEVDIAAQATVIRKDLSWGNIITNMTQLCGDASAYGSTKRNSDPAIGAEINTLARQGLHLSVADPVALYMHAADFSSFRLDPTGSRRGNPDEMIEVPEGTFSFLRGDIDKGWGLHLKVKIPEEYSRAQNGNKLNVSDLFDLNNGGQYVRYGSQFADYVTMSVSGIVANTTGTSPAQNSYAYTEPFVPPPVDLSMPVIKEQAESRTKGDAMESVSSLMAASSLRPLAVAGPMVHKISKGYLHKRA